MSSDQPDPRPRPQYGEYAPPGWVPPAPDLRQLPPPRPDEVAARIAPATPRRSWDGTASMILLALGLLGTTLAWITCIDLPGGLAAALAQQGVEVGTLPDWVAPAGVAVAVVHLVLYLFTAFGTVLLRRAGRPAAWLPLTAGILAAIVFWGVLSAVVAPYAADLTL